MKKYWYTLILFLFILCFGMTGFCEETISGSLMDVNPIYEGLLTDRNPAVLADEPSARSSAECPSFTSADAATAYMKEKMLSRETSVSFTLVSSSAISEDKMGTTVYDIVYGTMAYSPSGAPDEGDYLRWNYKGYKGGFEGMKSGSTYSYTITLTLYYHSSASQEKKLAADLKTCMASLDLDGKSEFDKAKAIYDYITSHVEYDSTGQQFSAYSAFEKGTAVCQGYASLFYRMCRMAGLQVRVISGKGGNESHGWNIVRVGNFYYNVDCTWDSEIGGTSYQYFLKSNSDFPNHTRDSAYRTSAFNASFPMASVSYNLNADHEHQWDTAYTIDVAPTCAASGTSSIHCTVCGLSKPSSSKTEARLSHSYGSWTVTKKATIFTEGKKTRTCSVCGTTETKTIAKKTASVSLNASSVTLQVKQRSSAVQIKKKTSGDIIARWTSSNPSVVYVKSSGRMVAKNTGTALVTVTMKSGASAAVFITVQKGTVKTKKLAFARKSLSLKTGSQKTLTLNRTPITANDKLKFTSSNPSVAKISSKGVVTALSPGTTTIKVKSSSGKTAKCTVTVK